MFKIVKKVHDVSRGFCLSCFKIRHYRCLFRTAFLVAAMPRWVDTIAQGGDINDHFGQCEVYHAAHKNYRRPLPEGTECDLRREMLTEMMSPMASSQLGTLP